MTESVARVSGALIVDELHIIEESYGRAALERALGLMSKEDRAHVDGITSVTWIPSDAADALIVAIAKALNRPILEVHAEIVHRSVARTLKTVWRVLLHFTTDDALVRRTPVFYGKTCDRGELTSKIIGPGKSELRMTGHPEASDIFIHGIAVGIGAVLEAAGRKEVRVARERTPSGALFTATWKK